MLTQIRVANRGWHNRRTKYRVAVVSEVTGLKPGQNASRREWRRWSARGLAEVVYCKGRVEAERQESRMCERIAHAENNLHVGMAGVLN